MSATVGMYSKVNPVEDNTGQGVRRSRFSFHFMTARTRRWLLVQWVSVPRVADEDEQATRTARLISAGDAPPRYTNLISDYATQSWLRRVA